LKVFAGLIDCGQFHSVKPVTADVTVP
jgi:hypothetical protein